MIQTLLWLLAGFITAYMITRINSLEDALHELEMRQSEHDRKTDEDIYKTETWRAAANYRFDDDEKDIGDLKAQCERFKGYIYRQTGEKV